ncbi:hypothetical protein CXG81DRAFT_11991 [Caulochytrium protostelioides]|uniref:Sec1-like protein n=2 Tax=Caulochytrium protostelioides TaxID=1555241 RepID=A0A4P9X838_9FUNG|nr:hypothetical protein CXG81DRAFT_11991 [Caulochytrium protostelioides]|eukprot:RKP01437.1 hypothetical protein CXG81DRAFT_11991 [Caulochytrium protostelioides]
MCSEILIDMIRSVKPPGGWKILILDEVALRIVNSCLKLSEVLDENVTLIETFGKKRQTFSQKEAIYFVSPIADNITRITGDFAPERRMYAAAHCFFTNTLSDDLFDQLRKGIPAGVLKAVKEVNADFVPFEPRVFHLDNPMAVFQLFRPSAPVRREAEIDSMTRKITSLCASLGELPHIRYHAATPQGVYQEDTLSSLLAFRVQNELDNLSRVDKDFPPPSPYPPAVLLIVDRTFDMMAPLLHEFTYQAMANDLLPFQDGRYICSTDDDGTTVAALGPGTPTSPSQQQTATLDESDAIWVLIRHWHFVEAVDYISDMFQRFLSENKAASNALSGQSPTAGIEGIMAMKDTLAHLPQFQEMKQRFAVHINICGQCKSEFESRKLDLVAGVEQDLATGETVDGRSLKNILNEIVPALADSKVSNTDKTRLLILYIIAQEGIQDMDRRKLLEAAKIPTADAQAITNLALFGLRLIPSNDSKKNRGPYHYWGNKQAKKSRKPKAGELPYDLSRYKPLIKLLLEDQIHNRVEAKLFPWVKEPPQATWSKRGAAGKEPGANGGAGTGAHAASGDNDDDRKRGPRIILFVIGGMTFSEMRSVYELATEHRRDILIGSTAIYNPTQWMNVLKEAHSDEHVLTKPVSVLTPTGNAFPKLSESEPQRDGEGATGGGKKLLNFLKKR